MTIASSRRSALVALSLGLALLAGCSRSAPEPAADVNDAAMAEPPPPPVQPAMPREETPAPKVAAVEKPAPEAPADPDAQMRDDADATGMTARVSRTDAATDNDAAAAEPAQEH